MGFFENLFANLAVPFEIANVFSAMKDIFDALPLVVKFAVISVAFLAIAIKILTIVFDFMFKFIDIFI